MTIRTAISVGMTVAGITLGGCATDDTEDTRPELETYDAQVAPQRDAARSSTTDPSTAGCTGTDPITLLLCQLTASGAGQTSGLTSQLSGLLNGLGGLGNIASVLGPVLGTTTQPNANPANGLIGLVNLAGGLGNIAQLLNQFNRGSSTLGPLFNGGAQTMQPTDLAGILAGFGIPVAGPPITLAQPPSLLDCSAPTLPLLQFACALLPPATR